jgi:hypothetical protein
MKQVDAVFESVIAVLSQDGRDEQLNTTPASQLLTSEERKYIKEQLVEGFRNGDIEMSDEARAKHFEGEGNINSYVNGLLNNWLKKDKRLNCGEAYIPKNPGSRSGQGDAQVRELKKLLAIVPEEQQAAVQAKIDERLEQLQKEKVKKVTIDIDKIPEELRHLIEKAG